MISEMYMLKFRNLKKGAGMSHSKYPYKMCDLMSKWVKGQRVITSYLLSLLKNIS